MASAFEDFLINVISEHNRHTDLCGKRTAVETPVREIEGVDSLRSLYTSLRWDINPIEYLLPLHKYFNLARNCIVHRSGRASKALVVYAESRLLTNCIETWLSKRGKTLPKLPQLQEGCEIPFLPRHSILFSEVCQRVATAQNANVYRHTQFV